MRTNWKLGIAFGAALAIAACNSGGAGKAGENKAGNSTTESAGNTTEGGNTSGGGGEATENEGGSGGGGGGESAGAQQDFTIVNNTGQTVMTLNVSPSNSNQWGPDILGTDTLANGQSGQIQFARGQDQCNWDIRVTYEDGQTGDWRGINLCETSTITLTAG